MIISSSSAVPGVPAATASFTLSWTGISSIWPSSKLSQRFSPLRHHPEDAQVVIDEIAPYWKGKAYHEALAVALPEETARRTFDRKIP